MAVGACLPTTCKKHCPNEHHKPEGEKQGEHVGKNNMRGKYDDAQLCVCTAEQKQLGSL